VAEPEIALAFTPEQWVEDLHRYFSDHGGARVRQLVVDPTLAIEEDYEVLVASHRWAALTRGLVDEVHALGRSVVGVYDPAEPAARALLGDLGVDLVLEADASPQRFVEAVSAVRPHHVRDHLPAASAVVEPAATRGSLVVVGGSGGSGRTEVAIQLAHALRATGAAALLVDADDVAPSVAQRLGLPLEPNLRTAVDAVEHGAGDLDGAIGRCPGAGPAVLAGLPSAATWSQLRPSEVARVVGALRVPFDPVVADVGPSLEDTGGSRRGRHEIARQMVRDASTVVVVIGGSPVGVARGLACIVEATTLAPDAPVHVLVNRAPPDGFRRSEVHDALAASGRVASVTFAPVDRRVERAAWAGTAVDRGPFTRSIARLAASLLRGGARELRMPA
jgi:Mrp family chromosome partitioning ATPase